MRGLDAARPERGALAAAGRAAEGDHPGCQGAKRPKLGDTAARSQTLPQSAGVRSRVRLRSRPVVVDRGKGDSRRRQTSIEMTRHGSQECGAGEGDTEGRRSRKSRLTGPRWRTQTGYGANRPVLCSELESRSSSRRRGPAFPERAQGVKDRNAYAELGGYAT